MSSIFYKNLFIIANKPKRKRAAGFGLPAAPLHDLMNIFFGKTGMLGNLFHDLPVIVFKTQLLGQHGDGNARRHHLGYDGAGCRLPVP